MSQASNTWWSPALRWRGDPVRCGRRGSLLRQSPSDRVGSLVDTPSPWTQPDQSVSTA